ncbi:MAG: hypothetical protein WA614_01650, partial [Acidimicrobiales bacterium]
MKPTRTPPRRRRVLSLLYSDLTLSPGERSRLPSSRFAFLRSDLRAASIDLPESNADEGRWARFAPLLLVGISVAYNLWGLRTLALSVAYPNDMAMHLQMITIAKDILSTGKFPLGQWYPYLSLGSPFFVQYQSFSAILTGALGEVIGVHHAIAFTLYL